jgi:dolichyl-phosphate-mannose-protein mannosyltransferase
MGFLERFNRPVVAVLAAGIFACCLNFTYLSRPKEFVFDEIYYAKDACLYTGGSLKECQIKDAGEKYWVDQRDEVGSWVHPPMGKWMIAAGEALFGADPFGWRFSSAIVGALTVMVTASMMWLFFRSTLWAFLAGVILATDGLFFVQSRLALLDVFLAFWVALGFLFVVLDRRWIHRRSNMTEVATGEALAERPSPSGLPVEPVPALPGSDDGMAPDVPVVTQLPPSVPSPLWRPWRLAAGLAFGAAAATKWSGAFALVGAVVLTLMWETARRRKAAVPHPLRRALFEESFGMLVMLAVAPAIVYVVAYARWWALNGFHPGKWWELQTAMREFHATLDRLKDNGKLAHPYESRPWDWFPMARPVNFYFKGPGSQVLDLGNPALFWGSILAIPYVAWRAARDPRAQLIVVAVFAQYLPWFVPPLVNRVQFFFYMTPIVPFMVLACGYALRDLARYRPRGATHRPFAPVAAGLIVTHLALFAYFWPVLTASPLSSGAWDARIWFPGWF